MKPDTIIIYEGKDVTRDFETIIESVTFKEYLENKASEIDLTLSNASGNFFNDWHPSIDDAIALKIGYAGSEYIDCGNFFVDEICLSGWGRSGDLCSIGGISAKPSSIHSPVAKKNYENKPISEIVNPIASSLGFTVKGDLSGNWTGIQVGTGLQFLEYLSKSTGRILKTEGTTLIFYKLENIKSTSPVGTIIRGDAVDYSVTDKAAGRISKCTVKCWDKTKKQLIEGTYDAGIAGGGSVEIWEAVDDTAAAKERAKDYVTDRNKTGRQMTVSCPGNVKYRVGVKVKTSGWGKYDQEWYIAAAEHSMHRSSGYKTTLTIQE